MTNLQSHIKELGKTLAPAYGPETPSEAVDRLLKYYAKLSESDKPAFVAALIGEVVAQNTLAQIEVRR